jgi:hypothetical protein
MLFTFLQQVSSNRESWCLYLPLSVIFVCSVKTFLFNCKTFITVSFLNFFILVFQSLYFFSLQIWFNPPFLYKCLYQVRVITVCTVFRLLTDFVCLYTYEFWLFVKSSYTFFYVKHIITFIPLELFKSFTCLTITWYGLTSSYFKAYVCNAYNIWCGVTI